MTDFPMVPEDDTPVLEFEGQPVVNLNSEKPFPNGDPKDPSYVPKWQHPKDIPQNMSLIIKYAALGMSPQRLATHFGLSERYILGCMRNGIFQEAVRIERELNKSAAQRVSEKMIPIFEKGMEVMCARVIGAAGDPDSLTWKEMESFTKILEFIGDREPSGRFVKQTRNYNVDERVLGNDDVLMLKNALTQAHLEAKEQMRPKAIDVEIVETQSDERSETDANPPE